MSGTLSSLNTALSALHHQRVAMDTASQNVANATTEGYSRRRVQGAAMGAPVTPALWSRYDGAAGGVQTSSVDRMVDPLLDSRARREHANQSFLDTRSAVLQRVETGIGEPGDSGVAAALADFRTSWHDLANNPGGDPVRSQVLSRARSLADAIHVQARGIATELAEQQVRSDATVSEVNTSAKELAETNRAIVAARANGVDASALLDQRDALTLRLADLAGATATVRPDGAVDVSIGSTPLVSMFESTPLAGDALPEGLSGKLGATRELIGNTLPGYAAALDDVARTLADQVNALHGSGYDLSGAAGGDFFSYDPDAPAASLALALTSPDEIAASGMPGGALDGSVAEALAGAGDADTAYQRLVNSFGTEVASVRRMAATQQMLTSQVDGAREQLGGVNLDEEMVNMLTAQRSYEAASRVMTVMDSVLDTLINRTGLLR